MSEQNILSIIQCSLNAPKNLYNSFGKYKYRNCEGILEALKPLLKEHNATIVLSDEIVDVCGRVYVKATATLNKGEQVWTAAAFAREDESKKGMDGSQITGSASSYARKYALNGLLAIDDTKDADDTNEHGKEEKVEQNEKPWYNTFQADKENMQASISTGKSTPESIISWLEKSYRVSKKVKDEIIALTPNA